MNKDKIVLKAVGVSRTYRGEVPVEALKKTDLSFCEGEFAAIVGRSGSGKSTLLRILGTLDIPDTGELFIGGESTSGMNDKELARLRRRRIGFVYQDYNLFPEYTAYENTVFPIRLDGRTEDRKDIEKLMEKLGILKCRDKFPYEMSGGEQQRISIARALAIEPAVILADEPTGNLDAENSKLVAELLKYCSEEYNRTVIMVTHDRGLADYADRIIRISDGNVIG